MPFCAFKLAVRLYLYACLQHFIGLCSKNTQSHYRGLVSVSFQEKEKEEQKNGPLNGDYRVS